MLRFPRRGTSHLLLLLIWIVTDTPGNNATAQVHAPRFEHLTITDGLSQSEVLAMLQDVYGFLWFGTTDGLNRHDGYNIITYRHSPKDSLSLSDDNITSLVNDPSGDILVGTMHGGLNRYLYKSGTFFHQYKINSFLAARRIYISAMMPFNETTLVLGTSDGQLLLFDQAADTFSVHSAVGRGNPVTALVRTRNGTLWAGTRGSGLHSVDPAGRTVTSFTSGRHLGDLPHNTVNALLVDYKGTLWVGTDNGLAILKDRNVFETYRHRPNSKHSLSNNMILSLFEDASRQLWIGTADGGINLFADQEGTFRSYQHDPDNPSSLSSGRINSIMQDRSGVLWFGTTGSGLSKLNKQRSRFTTYSSSSAEPFKLPGKDVMGVLEADNGILYIALFDAGLVMLDRKSGITRRIPGIPKGARSLYLDRKGNLWTGNETRGVHVLNLSTGELRQYTHDPNNPHSISHNDIRTIFEDASGTIWIGTFGGGLNRFDATTSRFMRIYRHSSEQMMDSQDIIMKIFQDANGTLWIGTIGSGLYQYVADSRTLHPARNTLTGRFDLRIQPVFGITELEPGVLWLATYGSGLMRYETSTGTITRIAEEQGFASSALYDVIPDKSGNLWISSNNGLIRYNPLTGAVRNFSVLDGLQSSEYNRGASWRSKSGETFFGGVAGLNAFFPDSISEGSFRPQIVVTSFSVFDEPYSPPQSLASSASITLRHDQNFIAFEFAALDFRAPERLLYTYTLEGIDREWIEPSNRRYARYTHLDPGEYVFKVKGTNSDGVWNQEAKELSIVILPPFHQKWWFRLLIGCVIAGILYLVYRIRMEKLLAIERMRVRIASDLHDDVGAALTKIALYTDLLKTNPSEDGVVDRIATMSREVIASMSDIVWAIDARNDTLEDLMDRINYYASEILAAKGIHLAFEKDAFPRTVIIPVEHRQNLHLIVKEAVNNIAKHSKATSALLRFTTEGGRVLIVIKDNGNGFADVPNRSGQGLRNMQMRAKRSGATLTIEHRHGTEIRLKTAVRT